MRQAASRTGARALVDGLVREGAQVLFGYPGGNVLDLFDALRLSPIRFVLARHEQGAVHMADGYARASGKVGLVFVTSGPGLTNAITGLGCAALDGVPLILVCGQVPLNQMGTDAFQEADTVGLTRSVSKHNFLVKSADEIPETIAQAFYIATHGKPGPVVIDVPIDCQKAPCAALAPSRVCLRAYHPDSHATGREISRLAKLVNDASRPLIYAGGGVIASEASDDVRALAEKAEIPVVTTMMGLGAMDERHPLALGMGGLYASDRAREAVRSADVVLALGVRFNDRTVGPTRLFAPRAKIVHVDCDASAINRNVPVDLGIVADVKDVLATVDSRIRPARHDSWLKQLHAKPAQTKDAAGFPLDAIVTTDVGDHQLWAARHLVHAHPRRFLSSGGLGAMGFGIPAAIGAKIARPDLPVVALVGDGGAQMTGEELIVAAQEGLPIVFVVFVNRTLELVREMQKTSYGGRFFATDLLCPDFVALAKASRLRAVRITSLAALGPAVRRALRVKRPTLVEVDL